MGPEGLSVHLGDALETQTSVRMLATSHQVLGQGVKRRSLVFFLDVRQSTYPRGTNVFECDNSL